MLTWTEDPTLSSFLSKVCITTQVPESLINNNFSQGEEPVSGDNSGFRKELARESHELERECKLESKNCVFV
jgi:hypothetical protein